mgnify:CR=1 FL=1
MTVGELRARIGEREYREWIAFYRLEGEQAQHARVLAKARRR